MSEKINVLDIEIDNLTAKEVMRKAIEYLDSEPVSIIEMVTADGLMKMNDIPNLKAEVCDFDLVLAGDKAMLEAAGVTEKRYLQETGDRVCLKMLLKYLHKNHRRVYLLAESEAEGEEFYTWIVNHYSGLQIAGIAVASAEEHADDMVVNAVNGGEVDCVFSVLSVPFQEEFIGKNRNALNARIWLGIGKNAVPSVAGRSGQGKFAQFILRRFFKREVEKQKKIQQVDEEK